MRKIKHFVINYLTRNLLKAVSEDDILRIIGKDYLYHKRKLSPEEMATLREEAQMLADSFLWKLMLKEVEYVAFLTMSSKAQKSDDILFGKAMFYSADLMRKFLEGLKR